MLIWVLLPAILWMCIWKLLTFHCKSLSLPFPVTEVPGGDGSGPVLHIIFLSWRAPQPNVRTFRSMAQGWMWAFHWNLHPTHFAHTCWEEGLRSIEGQTLDRPSDQQRGGRRARQDDRHYTAAVQPRISIPIIRVSLEPLAIETLLVVVAIVTKKRVFFKMHTKCKIISWHWMFVFLYVCLYVLMQ